MRRKFIWGVIGLVFAAMTMWVLIAVPRARIARAQAELTSRRAEGVNVADSFDRFPQPGTMGKSVPITVESVRTETDLEGLTESQRAVVKLVLVFHRDEVRRAVEGVMFDTGRDTWIVTASLATMVPKGIGKAIDRIYVEGLGPEIREATYVYSTPSLYFCRIPERLTSHSLASSAPSVERTKVAVGDELIGLRLRATTGHGRFFREPHKLNVVSLNNNSKFRLAEDLPVQHFENLILLNNQVDLGTPLFKNGELAAITVLGNGWPLDDKSGPSLAWPIEKIREECRRAVAMQAAEESLKEPAQMTELKTQSTATAESAAPLAEPELKMFHLEALEPEDAAKTLRSLFTDPANGHDAVRIAANASSNTVIVSGPPDDLLRIEATLKQLDEVARQLQVEQVKRLNAIGLARPSEEDPANPNPQGNSASGNTGAAASFLRGGLSPTGPQNAEDLALDNEAQQLAAKVRAAEGPERDKLRAELEALTDRHFEQRQLQRKQEIDDLANRVDRMRVAHARRNEQKAEIVKRRVEELLDKDREFKWDEKPAENKPPTVDPTNLQRR